MEVKTPEKENLFLRNLKNIDWIIVFIVIFIVITGLVLIYSATLRKGSPLVFVSKQTLAFLIGTFSLVVFMSIDYRFFRLYYKAIFYFGLVILLSVLLFGKVFRGSQSWFDFRLIAFQPSEITKLLFIVSLAGYLDINAREMRDLHKLFFPVLMLFSNVILILLQPDFSATLVYFVIFLGMLYCAGASILHLSSFVLIGSIAIGFPLLKTLIPYTKIHWPFIIKIFEYKWEMLIFLLVLGVILFIIWWFLGQMKIYIPIFYFICTFCLILSGMGSSYFVNKAMKEYQKKRMVVFLNPKVDQLGAGYNIIQSKIAIGSGRLFGKGLFSGTQTQLGFLPAQHTDFIFSLLAEELGFSFSLLVLVLYMLLVWRIIRITAESRDRYGALIGAGMTSMFGFYGILNIGMSVGVMPITGLPLPFMSYGGSSLFSSLTAIGILLSICIRRYMY